MLFAVLGIPLKKELGLNDTEFGLLAATPVLSGSLIRVPLGIWTDRYGGRVVFFVLMLLTVIPIWLISYAHTLWQLLVLGLFVGLAGGSFSVGTPYVARWFPRSRQGLAMGIFGAGNSGAALTKFVAPALILAAGTWEIVPKVYSVAMLITAIVFWLFSRSNPAHRVSSATSWRAQLPSCVIRVSGAIRSTTRSCSAATSASLWMTKYYIGEYGFDMKTAAFLAACFSLPGGVLRAIGGWISDRYGAHRTTWWVMWVSWVTFFLLSYPRPTSRSTPPTARRASISRSRQRCSPS
jgi:NNP family nitrate/nitrite transporter-like MFS transporter